MFTQVLSEETRNVLALLSKDDFFQKAYLAGGTALALQLGHRLSFDLDFYSKEKFDEQEVLGKLKQIGDFCEVAIDWQTISGSFPRVKFSFFYYQYPLIKPAKKYSSILIASLEDISAMKIAAIVGRGTKRDFIDLYFLANRFALKEILKFYDKKYHNLDNLYPHIVKSLNYFEDADKDEMPQMLKKCDWSKVKKFFLDKVPEILDKKLKGASESE